MSQTSKLNFKHILAYVMIFGTLFLLANYSLPLYRRYVLFRHASDEEFWLDHPIGKAKYVKKFANDLDIVFVGDSRTHIGIDPKIISTITGKKAFNAGSIAHNFITQYPQYRELAPYLKDKYVVLTLNHINFAAEIGLDGLPISFDIKNVEASLNYYLRPHDFFLYAKMGIRGLWDNLMVWLLNRDLLIFRSDLVRRKYNLFLSKKISIPFLSSSNSVEMLEDGDTNTLNSAERETLQRVLKEIGAEQELAFRQDFEFGTKIPKAVYKVYKRNGQLEYWEVRSAYLRQKQLEWKAQTVSLDKFTEHPMHMELFKRMLAIFKQNKVRLIVNEYWDAPYQYDLAWNKELYVKYLKKIKAMVEAQGFSYISVDFSSFSNRDYYDYDHMNAQGARKYSRLLGRKLLEVLK